MSPLKSPPDLPRTTPIVNNPHNSAGIPHLHTITDTTLTTNQHTQLLPNFQAEPPPSSGRAGIPPPSGRGGFERGLRATTPNKKRKCRSLHAYIERKNKQRTRKRIRRQLQRDLRPQYFTNTRTETWANLGPYDPNIITNLALQANTINNTTTHNDNYTNTTTTNPKPNHYTNNFYNKCPRSNPPPTYHEPLQ
jgi:hypothetical protein